MILSILIPSLINRSESLMFLKSNLVSQLGVFNYCVCEHDSYTLLNYYNNNVEILVDIDNKQVTTGEKRNRLLKSAKGKYIAFIDDDDEVPNCYIEQMLIAADSDTDCFAINGKMTTDGKNEIKWRLSKDYDNVTIKENGVDIYLRKTNHITAVKRELALMAMFPDKSNAEDKAYSDSLNKYLKTEYKIELPMYHYKFSTKNKEY